MGKTLVRASVVSVFALVSLFAGSTALAQLGTEVQARIANGELKGWSIWGRVFSYGAGTSYDALNVMYFRDFASAIQGLDSTKGVETFMKTHPGKSCATYISNLRDYSELQERNLMQVVALVERAR